MTFGLLKLFRRDWVNKLLIKAGKSSQSLQLKDRCNLIRQKVKEMGGPQNSALVFTHTLDHIIEQSQIKFLC